MEKIIIVGESIIKDKQQNEDCFNSLLEIIGILSSDKKKNAIKDFYTNKVYEKKSFYETLLTLSYPNQINAVLKEFLKKYDIECEYKDIENFKNVFNHCFENTKVNENVIKKLLEIKNSEEIFLAGNITNLETAEYKRLIGNYTFNRHFLSFRLGFDKYNEKFFKRINDYTNNKHVFYIDNDYKAIRMALEQDFICFYSDNEDNTVNILDEIMNDKHNEDNFDIVKPKRKFFF